MKPCLTLWITVMILLGAAPGTALALTVKDQKIHLESVEDFTPCTNKFEVDDCLASLDAWLRDHPADAGRAAKSVRLNSNASNAVPYYALALAQKPGACGDTDALDAAVAALKLPSDRTLVAGAKKLAFETCWDAWKEDLAGDVEGKNPYFLRNSCPALLKKKGALNAVQSDICRKTP